MARIWIRFTINQPSTYIDVWKAKVKNNLELTGWSVNDVILSAVNGNRMAGSANVNGSNSDNMSTVARSFTTVMSRVGVPVTNVSAAFETRDNTVITGTTPNGNINTTNTQVPTGNNNPKPQAGFFDSFAQSLGVSTAILAIAGVAILIVVVKK